MTGAGLPHSDTLGSQLGWQLPEAYRSLPRPSSAPDAKTSTACPYTLTTQQKIQDNHDATNIKMLASTMHFSKNNHHQPNPRPTPTSPPPRTPTTHTRGTGPTQETSRHQPETRPATNTYTRDNTPTSPAHTPPGHHTHPARHKQNPNRPVPSGPNSAPPTATQSLTGLLRKEVIQPHLPVRLPCYDFVPIADPTFDHSPPPKRVRPWASGVADFRDVTGGVYKARERIHRSVADLRLLATPTSRGRVADPDPN
jgi:hypothetical protein